MEVVSARRASGVILCYFHYVSVQSVSSVSVFWLCFFLLFNFDCVREAELKPMCEFACV